MTVVHNTRFPLHLSSPFVYHGNKETTLFGAALAFGLFTVFLFPICACWILAFDANVSFWFGRYIFWWTLPIPFFFMFVVIRQLMTAKPKRGLLLMTWVFPTVGIFVLAGILNSQASHLADRLVSQDCRTFPTLRPISKSYWRAQAHLETCLGNQTYYMHSKTVLQACPKYQQWYKEEEHPEYWDYLQYLEDNHDCTGFCLAFPGGVWSIADSKATKDSCSRAIVSVLRSKVIRLTHQLMGTPVVVLFATVLWMYLVRPTFSAYYSGKPDVPPAEQHLSRPQYPPQYGAINSPPPPAAMPPPMRPGTFAPAPLPAHMRTLPPGSLPPGAMIPGGFAPPANYPASVVGPPPSASMPAGYPAGVTMPRA